jgi:hypothetical protein
MAQGKGPEFKPQYRKNKTQQPPTPNTISQLLLHIISFNSDPPLLRLECKVLLFPSIKEKPGWRGPTVKDRDRISSPGPTTQSCYSATLVS